MGLLFLAKTVFIAAGVGAFTPRKLSLPELDAFEGKQVFYTSSGLPDVQAKNVVVVGGDDEALQVALEAVSLQARSVTLVHRRNTLDADAELLKTFHEAVTAQKIHFITAQISHTQSSNHELTGLQLQLIDGSTRQVTCDLLLIHLGISPQLGPLADWGLDMARKQLNVNTEDFSTSASGIFAVGDINTYPGKRKLIVSGFHEATLAAFGAAAYSRPGQKIPLEYTTASPRLHRLLGV